MSHELEDGDMDRLLAGTVPRPPAGFVEGTMWRIAGARRARRVRLFGIGASTAGLGAAGCLVAALALAHTFKVRFAGPFPRGMARPSSGWKILEAKRVPGLGTVLSEDARLALIEGARAVLARDSGQEVELKGPAVADARTDSLWLEWGGARLAHRGTTVSSDVARVIAVGEAADVEVSLAAARAPAPAVMTVIVQSGAARVERADRAAPVSLAAGDRMLVTNGAPPLSLKVPRFAAVVGALAAARPPADPAEALAGDFGVEPARRGSLDKAAVTRGIADVIQPIKECYDQALAEHPRLAGKIVVDFTIKARGGKGRIDVAELAPPAEEGRDLDSPLFAQCLLNALAKAEWPEPAGGGEVRVHYPFLFTVADPEDDD